MRCLIIVIKQFVRVTLDETINSLKYARIYDMPKKMSYRKLNIHCVSISLLFWMVKGAGLPWPDFESGWLPIINGLEHVARLNIDHGLTEIPVLVDVSVKVMDTIFPASGFRPDHPKERTGPVVYIYDDTYVNVSTSPTDDRLYRMFPRVSSRYDGKKSIIVGKAQVRVRAWKHSSLPLENFRQSGIMLKANTSKVYDSYAEVSHNMDEKPCLVVVRMKMQHGGNTIMADGVGSCMQVFTNVPERTNAYLVYGYSNTTFRLWVDSSSHGAIFDGRKHTWFDMVISEGEAEIYAWKCSTLTPLYNKRVVKQDTKSMSPEWYNLDVGYDLEPSLIRVSVQAEESGGANVGFRFPGAMHLGYTVPLETGSTEKHPTVGGLSYAYKTKERFNFWQPIYNTDDKSTIFIADSFGSGTNSEISSSESVHIQSWIYEENDGCPTPVIPNGLVDMPINGTSTGTRAIVRCMKEYVLTPKDMFNFYDEKLTITCHKFGYWENIPRCVPKEKEVDIECNPAVDKCRDIHAMCTLIPERGVYSCTCNNGFRYETGRCKPQGKYLPKADYDSDWVPIRKQGPKWHLELEHGLGIVPVLVDVQVEIKGYIFHAIGFVPDQDDNSYFSAAVVYVYDESFINISSLRDTVSADNHISIIRANTMWYGYQYGWYGYGKVRARAWKLKSIPSPDLLDDTRVLHANTSKASDSFYELEHDLGEYPGLVVVRAKMVHNGNTFYADGVGSALNVYYNKPNMTNAFLVYGFSDKNVRTWVDSSIYGAIFDGRKHMNFDIVVSEATVEIYAWQISTLTPFFTYMFSLEDDRMADYFDFAVSLGLSDALNVAVAQVKDPTSQNEGFRFPSSSYLADRNMSRKDEDTSDCIFGGFTYGYNTLLNTLPYSKDVRLTMMLYKPKHYVIPSHHTGALVCIPDSFGNGQYSDAAFDGIGIMHSWINADCGTPPEVENGYINTTLSGTELGAVAVMECDDGYWPRYNMPFCHRSLEWEVNTRCIPVECDPVKAPENGTMHLGGLTFSYGYDVTFKCNVGFKLNGTAVIKCLSTRVWSAKPPVCIKDNTTSRSARGRASITGILLATALYSAFYH